jgi:para-nitrobenzyl esterase
MTRPTLGRRSFLALTGAPLAASAFHLHPGAVAPQQAVRTALTNPIATTTSGSVRGLLRNRVNSFLGVPYGAPTGGAARFQPPVKPVSWTGVRDTVDLGPRSPQPVRIMVPEMGDALTGTGPMNEDCLRLNVWTPAVGRGTRRPVMVYLHGGGFRTGSGGSIVYDGAELARKHDVVVVTINHRLNVFGFLYLAEIGGDKYAKSSNVGMLDIVAALEWVRDNIEGFGGDPTDVMVFGQSGGGGKTAILTAWPGAKGLFHRAAIQSTLSDTAVRALTREDAMRATETMLARLNVKPNGLDALQKMPVEQLLDALVGGAGRAAGEVARDVQPAGQPLLTGDISLRFTPVVDGRTLLVHPYDPVASEISANVPLLCGSVETESVPYQGVNDPYWTTTDIDAAGLRDRVKRSLGIDDQEADRTTTLYRRDRPKASNMDLATIIASDNSALRTSAHAIAERKSALGKAPVYQYYFQWYSPLREGRVRCMHCMELPFVFDHVDDCAFMVGTGQDRQAIADKVSAAWVAFARTGNPNHAGLPAWKPFTAAERATMVFDRESKAVNDPYAEERRALKAIRERAGGR